jgi:type II secretory pathway pseudopilin PulG
MKLGRKGQSGLSMFTLLFVVGVLACLAVLAAQVLPTAMEYQAILKAAQKAANDGGTAAQMRAVFGKAAQIDNIESVVGQDLEISKEGDKVVVKFAYNKEIHMFGPAFLLIKYAGQTK